MQTDLWNGLFLLVPAVAVTITPWCRVLTLLGTMMFMNGLGKGALASGKTF